MGCQSVETTFTKMRGRGEVTTVNPSAGNGWRGELHIDGGSGKRKGLRGMVYSCRNDTLLTCAFQEEGGGIEGGVKRRYKVIGQEGGIHASHRDKRNAYSGVKKIANIH